MRDSHTTTPPISRLVAWSRDLCAQAAHKTTAKTPDVHVYVLSFYRPNTDSQTATAKAILHTLHSCSRRIQRGSSCSHASSTKCTCTRGVRRLQLQVQL